MHERKHSDEMNAHEAEADLRAHQQRHPRYFKDGRDYLVKLQTETDKLNQKFDLTGEMEQAKNLVNTMYDRVSAYEKDRAKETAEIHQTLENLQFLLKSHESLDDTQKERLGNDVEAIRNKLTCPLTEKGSHGPVEMSYATMARLQMESSESLARLAERVQKLKAIDMITREAFKVWLSLFHQHVKQEFGTGTYTKAGLTAMIVEGIGKAMMETGEPRRGI